MGEPLAVAGSCRKISGPVIMSYIRPVVVEQPPVVRTDRRDRMAPESREDIEPFTSDLAKTRRPRRLTNLAGAFAFLDAWALT
jgi:hypothetical protein